jgi:PBSX family phage terminase large subunit
MFKGTFYRRFVLGEWVAAEGLVYDRFREEDCPEAPEELEHWCISCDYGTINPASFGLWGLKDGVWYRVEEFYYDSKRNGRQLTDGEYAERLKQLAGEREIRWVVVDPSAASFIEILRRDGWRVMKAKNDVLSGIRITAELLRKKKLVICKGCKDAIREFALYRWEEDGTGDRVRKQDDHAMDDIRYFAATIVEGQGAQVPTFAGSVCRQSRM